jgi:hypothetical protein
MSKYRNVRTEIDGIVFDSKREATRYQDLKLLERVGLIGNLQRQVRIPLEVNGEKVCDYIVDFKYHENERVVLEDCKGMRTPVYLLKKKLVRACLGMEIRET